MEWKPKGYLWSLILASPEKVYGISLQRKCEGGRWVLLPSLFATKLHLSHDSLRAYDGGRTVRSSWEWVSLWVCSLEIWSALHPVFPGGTWESIRDCARTIWAVPKTLLLHHLNYSSQSRWEKQVTAGSLLTSVAWTSTDDKPEDSYWCCLIISFK